MAEGYLVNPTALRTAATTWDDQSEVLRGGKKRLLDAEDAVADLGPRLGPAATAFISTWLTQVQDLVDAAEGHAEALDATAADYTGQDQVVGHDLAQLLPWGQHDGAPTPHYTSTGGPQ
ncbi:WXG100 family type VII secretion target [Nocardioides marmoraquaticus]